jgi:hypothetical protein
MRSLIVAACLLTVPIARAGAQCLGDFNGDGKVLINEIVTAVNNALDDCQLIGPRFVDNGDGTVTDHKTGLVWEKKNFTCPGAHCVNDSFTWCTGPYPGGPGCTNSANPPDGTAFTTFLYGLNGGTSPDGVGTSGCFTGHCDWRLPTIRS